MKLYTRLTMSNMPVFIDHLLTVAFRLLFTKLYFRSMSSRDKLSSRKSAMILSLSECFFDAQFRLLFSHNASSKLLSSKNTSSFNLNIASIPLSWFAIMSYTPFITSCLKGIPCLPIPQKSARVKSPTLL